MFDDLLFDIMFFGVLATGAVISWALFIICLLKWTLPTIMFAAIIFWVALFCTFMFAVNLKDAIQMWRDAKHV